MSYVTDMKKVEDTVAVDDLLVFLAVLLENCGQVRERHNFVEMRHSLLFFKLVEILCHLALGSSRHAPDLSLLA